MLLFPQVDHISTITAPGMIIATFCQTIAVFMELDIEWPPRLRRLMQALNILNINIQLARPECTFAFGVKQRLQARHAAPTFSPSSVVLWLC